MPILCCCYSNQHILSNVLCCNKFYLLIREKKKLLGSERKGELVTRTPTYSLTHSLSHILYTHINKKEIITIHTNAQIQCLLSKMTIIIDVIVFGLVLAGDGPWPIESINRPQHMIIFSNCSNVFVFVFKRELCRQLSMSFMIIIHE